MLKQWPTEDGYLMLTIARNMSLGLGMSTANGTLPTNGTRPGFNFVEAALFALVHGDKRSGVLLTQVVSLAIALLAAWTLFRLGQRVLRERSFGGDAAAIAAAAWYASANLAPHSMNCLETGLYHLLILRALLVWHRFAERRAATTTVAAGGALGLGVLLGAMLWVRIDGVFLLAAVCLAHLATGFARGAPALRARLIEATLAGAVAVAVLSPWLIHNKTHFGSFMPISGTAQAFGAQPGDNLSSGARSSSSTRASSCRSPTRSSGRRGCSRPLLAQARRLPLRHLAHAPRRERGRAVVPARRRSCWSSSRPTTACSSAPPTSLARYLSPLSIGFALATTAGAFALTRSSPAERAATRAPPAPPVARCCCSSPARTRGSTRTAPRTCTSRWSSGPSATSPSRSGWRRCRPARSASSTTARSTSTAR
jgi:hypothetical protein